MKNFEKTFDEFEKLTGARLSKSEIETARAFYKLGRIHERMNESEMCCESCGKSFDDVSRFNESDFCEDCANYEYDFFFSEQIHA